MPYILTPAGWRVLSENAESPKAVPRKKAPVLGIIRFKDHANNALKKYGEGNYSEGSKHHVRANRAYEELPDVTKNT